MLQLLLVLLLTVVLQYALQSGKSVFWSSTMEIHKAFVDSACK